MLNNKKIRVIFFDLDDTLLDAKTSKYKAINEFKKKMGVFENIAEENFAKVWDSVTYEQYEKYAKGEVSIEQHKINRIKNLFMNFNVNITDKEAQDYFEIYSKINEKYWILFEDTIEVLEALSKKYILAIITNGSGIQQRKKIRKLNIEHYFKEIIVSDEIGISKPNKKIYELACNKLNEKPEECLMCGDQLNTDVYGALNAGMNAVWINRNPVDYQYQYQINNLKKLLKIF